MIWLLLLAVSFAYGQEEIPKIVVDADDFHGFPETFGLLSVEMNGVNGASYSWRRNGEKITKKTRPPFSSYDSKTLIPSKTYEKKKEYAGTYQVVVTAKTGIINGRNVTVAFTYPGEFDPNLPKKSTVDVTVGQANFIKCPKHEPGSNVLYKWGKSSKAIGTKLMESQPNHIVLDDGTLFYSHLTQDDVSQFNSNEWTCGMEAKFGETNQFKWADHVKTQFRITENNLTLFGPKIVTPLPQNKMFQERYIITMKCAATGRPTPTYSWKRIDVYGKNHSVENGKDGITFDDGDARLLVINSATKNHAGRYFCTATIDDKSDTVEGSLSFEIEPTWIGQRIESEEPSIYSSHSWTCNATGFPMPTYKWYKNGVALDSSDSHEINDGTINFKSLKQTDTAMYQCVAENRVNNIYQTAYLDVQAEKPSFDTNTGKSTLFLGAKGVIECKAKAAPIAKNTWTKDGISIDLSLDRYTLVKGNLVIDEVSKQDVGNYSCKAENIYGNDVKKISVQVVGEITFITEPQDVNVEMGGRVELNCQAQGDQDSTFKATIKYKWEFNGKAVGDNTNSLVLSNTQVNQSGIYECIAYIDKPSYAEKKRQAEVIVKGPPQAPYNVRIDGDCNSFSAKLKWEVAENRYATIKHFIIETSTTWFKVSERPAAANMSEKTIRNLSPGAMYRFRVYAVNDIGNSTPSVPTLFKNCVTPSSAPTICPAIKAKAGKENELALSWEKIELIDQNGKDFEYVLEYHTSDPTSSQTKTFDPVELEFDIPDAGYYQLWTFKIKGRNDAGEGPVCEGSAYSGQNAPNLAPPDFAVENWGANFVVLKWRAISLSRGNVDGYKLAYRQVPKSTRSRRSISAGKCDMKNPCEVDIAGGDKTSTRVEGLLPYTRYEFTLSGYNSGGVGPSSIAAVQTQQGKPGVPDAVEPIPFAKFIRLRWKEPKMPNGEITKYHIFIDKHSNPRNATVDRHTREYLFGGLVPNTGYSLSIQAETTAGVGDKARVPVTTSTPRAPAKPAPPVLKGFGENSVNVTFKQGLPEKGFPETFYVGYRVKGETKWNQTKPVVLFGPNSKPFIEIHGLDKDKEYEMVTVAKNDAGASDRSDVKTVKPGDGRPARRAESSPIYKRSWFVAVVVVVCFLLIILLVALLVTRKRGERYPVGKREKKRAGILDVGEEPDYTAHQMKPPRQNGNENGVNRQNSGASLPNRDPDRDSLDDYEDDRFEEDAASLIGAYNDDRRANKHVDQPEFV